MSDLIGKRVVISETVGASYATGRPIPLKFYGIVSRLIKGGEVLSDAEVEEIYYKPGAENYSRRIFETFKKTKFDRVTINREKDGPLTLTLNPLLWKLEVDERV